MWRPPGGGLTMILTLAAATRRAQPPEAGEQARVTG